MGLGDNTRIVRDLYGAHRETSPVAAAHALMLMQAHSAREHAPDAKSINSPLIGSLKISGPARHDKHAQPHRASRQVAFAGTDATKPGVKSGECA